MNRALRVLVACEESQAVCKAFRTLGHEAYSCDIQEPSGGHPEWHIHGDVLPLLGGCCEFVTMDGAAHQINGKWDLLIAHPPCTYLSAAGACRLFNADHSVADRQREKRGREARAFFMRFIQAECQHICVENPAPLSIFALPPYTQIIEPYFFGDKWKKRTCLWLVRLPQLVPDNVVEPEGCWTIQGGGKTNRIKLKTENPVARNAKERSRTFPAIARAMAEQWSEYILNGPEQLTIDDLQRRKYGHQPYHTQATPSY